MIRFEVWVRTRIINKKGELIKEQYFKSKSFLLHYARMIGVLFGYRTDSVLDEGGTSKTIWGYIPDGSSAYGCFYNRVNAGDNDASYGIVVGSGDTPVSTEDYALASKIEHGVGAGLLDYEPCSVSSVSYETYPAPGWARIIISRSFVNLSGATITVREIGLMLYNRVRYADTVRSNVKFLILRDVLPAPDDIPDGYTYSVSYEIRWSA